MTDKSVLYFPVQKEDLNDLRLTDQELIYQLKLKAADLLNNVAAGTSTLTMLNIRSLLEVNALCLEVGIPPLDYDIDALTTR